ncbi:ABC transporter substrate-binding protein [Rhodococcus sp. H29-C3]|uniref:ABC transporter substrate-binding protein n=1 Tax=Rhodococcus sp. H29-C3 TaxID=3046307 RepID=UPI0024B9A08F|nr:ABC transporter substrate-binding protein [Rhodococcus sp. H29-C3]MDJ0362919.1 ABC transporter substrate-binding protein [Rhodococcus sp. H29-C3]
MTSLTSCAQSTDSDIIRFALDWTPNTNHTGLYVALQEGYFADAGLDVEVLPYNSTSPDTLVDAGNAEFGISTQSSTTFAKTAGAQIISVLAPLQHWATGIGVKADREDIPSPKALDGKVYAGFGDTGEKAGLRQVIQNDGGAGEYETVVLGTSAYEAVYSGTADFTVSYLAWEGIEAEHSGTPMKYFDYTDYGFPDAYALTVNGNENWLASHPDEAKQFVQALQRGYQLAADDPVRAAQDIIDANPGVFTDEQLVFESQQMLADRYMLDESGAVGRQNLDKWTEYSKFLYENGVLVDEAGNAVDTEPDWSTYFTDDYLGAQ